MEIRYLRILNFILHEKKITSYLFWHLWNFAILQVLMEIHKKKLCYSTAPLNTVIFFWAPKNKQFWFLITMICYIRWVYKKNSRIERIIMKLGFAVTMLLYCTITMMAELIVQFNLVLFWQVPMTAVWTSFPPPVWPLPGPSTCPPTTARKVTRCSTLMARAMRWRSQKTASTTRCTNTSPSWPGWSTSTQNWRTRSIGRSTSCACQMGRVSIDVIQGSCLEIQAWVSHIFVYVS